MAIMLSRLPTYLKILNTQLNAENIFYLRCMENISDARCSDGVMFVAFGRLSYYWVNLDRHLRDRFTFRYRFGMPEVPLHNIDDNPFLCWVRKDHLTYKGEIKKFTYVYTKAIVRLCYFTDHWELSMRKYNSYDPDFLIVHAYC